MTWRNLKTNPPESHGVMVFRFIFESRPHPIYLMGTCDACGEHRLYSMHDLGGKYVHFSTDNLDDLMAEKRILRIDYLVLDEVL